MAWDEWEQLKADAQARRQNQMRLDSAAGTGGSSPGGAPDLKTNKAGKDAAVKALQGEIPRETDKAGSHADESSATAVREFSGWETGAGLKDAHAEWELQVKNLKGRLGQDQAALEDSHQHLQYVDYGVGSRTAQIDAGPHPRR
ncbi:hypothetical protein [Streptomyces sp. Ag109_G2-15]|uniref:hypothetical protein n=1 Tax=Streptomyces sp. Ag109_G2-15 TaxID=1938850 RepID=UPI000BC41E45|nr:hypothetical protein [Streptomyces sp. Ag109_G2-15]SOD85883.1 hypothetical protein SAMN06272765_3319 [Streptomyces sp. Ag109_G2-15]